MLTRRLGRGEIARRTPRRGRATWCHSRTRRGRSIRRSAAPATATLDLPTGARPDWARTARCGPRTAGRYTDAPLRWLRAATVRADRRSDPGPPRAGPHEACAVAAASRRRTVAARPPTPPRGLGGRRETVVSAASGARRTSRTPGTTSDAGCQTVRRIRLLLRARAVVAPARTQRRR